mmetsp:Transcript_25397/g.37107  ORF Transcript_25397/g.37107 Transcript_25397/m.37107 type:complete len:238 (-) Transcript_25397:53-766(-)
MSPPTEIMIEKRRYFGTKSKSKKQLSFARSRECHLSDQSLASREDTPLRMHGSTSRRFTFQMKLDERENQRYGSRKQLLDLESSKDRRNSFRRGRSNERWSTTSVQSDDTASAESSFLRQSLPKRSLSDDGCQRISPRRSPSTPVLSAMHLTPQHLTKISGQRTSDDSKSSSLGDLAADLSSLLDLKNEKGSSGPARIGSKVVRLNVEKGDFLVGSPRQARRRCRERGAQSARNIAA